MSRRDVRRTICNLCGDITIDRIEFESCRRCGLSAFRSRRFTRAEMNCSAFWALVWRS